ncbi:unnamed protein product [Vicia faba]|uniref:Uncharacterized protein n=1 Tax=Vicia faba TaxID=3906 RepID=A0AAV0ZEC6_VICFA|nr:unnamed protein product [Vicia faba]
MYQIILMFDLAMLISCTNITSLFPFSCVDDDMVGMEDKIVGEEGQNCGHLKLGRLIQGLTWEQPSDLEERKNFKLFLGNLAFFQFEFILY